jgi:multiple antibiotic resistance protein
VRRYDADLEVRTDAALSHDTPAEPVINEATPGHTPVGFSEMLTFLFVMVGPMHVLGPFAKLTSHFTEGDRRQLAWRTAAAATIALIVGAFLGSSILQKWHVSPGALLIAGSVILFLVAVSLILQSPRSSADATLPNGASDKVAVGRACFAAIATPYGIALLVCLVSLQPQTIALILGALLLVMVLDLLTMLYATNVLHWLGPPLQIFGSILSILQVALSIQLMFVGFRLLLGAAP